MAFPYSSGDVLTAADLNASSGLVLVKSQSIGSAVSSVTVTDAFSSTFQNYRVIISGVDASATGGLNLQFGSTTTGYYGVRRYYNYSGSNGFVTVNNGSNLSVGTTDVSSNTSLEMTVYEPNRADRCAVSGLFFGTGYAGWFGGTDTSATAQTAFTLIPDTGTLTGGTIKVYGYNNG